jgi:dTDP-4-amino-4,6-dideoxygalactose transaminase
VRLLDESGRAASEIAWELEVAVEYLYRWRGSVQKARAIAARLGLARLRRFELVVESPHRWAEDTSVN